MSRIKFLKSSYYYDQYLADFYASRPGLSEEPYNIQLDLVMHDCHSWSDFWKRNLEATGNYEVEEVVINSPVLQKKWAATNGIKFNEENWQLDILEAQLKEFKPDVWFAHDYNSITPDFRMRMKREIPSIKMVLGYDGIAMYEPSRFEGCDVILSVADFIIKQYAAMGVRGYLVPSGFEPLVLDRIKKRPPVYDATFAGSVFLFKGGHMDRLALLADVARKAPVEYFLNGLDLPLYNYFREQLGRFRRGKFKEFNDVRLVRAKNRGAHFGLEMFQLLADSKITLNHHIDVAKNEAANLRLFEATGMGALLLTDWKDNLPDFFEIDKEIVAFRSADEAAEKIRYLLDHEDERKQIAAAGQKKTLENYNFAKRMEAFSAWLQNNL